jgi:Pectate lyase superfamily protein
MIIGATAVAAPYAPAGPKIFGTSASEVPVDIIGAKTFVMNEFALAFQVGVRLRMTATENLGAWIEGVVQSYDTSTKTLVILPDRSSGTGTYDNWSINVAGEPGPQGPVGPTGPVGPVPEAPNDGTLYGRRNLGWAIVSTEGIGEAPADSNNYARRNGVWNNVDVVYQPLDADLTALAALTGTNAIYYRSAANTWAAVTVGANLTFTGGVLAATAASGAPLDSPTFTGNPTAPTPTVGDNDTSIATTAFVNTAMSGKADASALTNYQPLDADLTALAALTGTNAIYYRSAANTWAAVTIGTNLNFTAGVLSAPAIGASLDSPVFTGDPRAPTPVAGDNDTSIATTAFVQAALGIGGTGIGIGTVTGGTLSRSNADRFPEYGVNIRDFGAVADGTTDVVLNIQAAIDFMFTSVSTRCAVYVPPGSYKTSSRPIFFDPPGNMRGADGTYGNNWNASTTYSTNNTVNRLGIPYIALAGNINNPPELSLVYWRPFNWDSSTTYAFNEIARHGGVPWQSLQSSNTNHDPLTSPTWWKPHFIQPTNFAFSGRFFGAHGTNHEGKASRFNFGNDTVEGYGVIMGPGQGMQIDHLVLLKTATAGTSKKAKKGRGLAIAGGPGGATRTTIADMLIEQWSTGIAIGWNQDSLADSNFMFRCNVWGCYVGCWIHNSQNFINEFIECSFANLIQIQAGGGQSFNVYGGNYSCSCDRAVFTLTAVSAVSQSGSNPVINRFTATITNGDALLDQGCYERFAVKTARWGVVPLELVNWDTTTDVITLQIDTNWQTHVYGLNYNVSSSFSADIQACTKLYANEWARAFIGAAKIRGIHVENANAVNTLVWNKQSFSNSNTTCIEDIFINSTITGGDANDSEPGVGVFLIQTVTPFLFYDAESSANYIRNLGLSAGAGRVNFNIWSGRQVANIQVKLDQCDRLNLFVLGTPSFQVISDINPCLPGQVDAGDLEWQWQRFGDGHSDFLKYWPHPASVPMITESILTAWLANTSAAEGAFPPMMGSGQVYKLRSTTTLADVVNIKSNHQFLTLGGGNITRNWAYKAGSCMLYMASAANMRQGQVIVLNNGVDGDQLYLILAVWVVETSGNSTLCLVNKVGGGTLTGVAGTEYTGTVISHQATNVTYDVVGQTNFSAPVTGFTMALANRDTKVILAPAGTLASGTITMCASPRDRQIVEIRSSQAITALTIAPGAGQTVASPPTTIAAGGLISAYYRAANLTWYF